MYHRLVMLCVDLLLDENLVLLEKSRLKLDVSGLVSEKRSQSLFISTEQGLGLHSVDISKSCRNAEEGGNLAQRLVNVVNVLWLGVETVVVNVFVVDAVLFTTRDTNLHLEPLLHGSSALEVLLRGSNVVFLVLF